MNVFANIVFDADSCLLGNKGKDGQGGAGICKGILTGLKLLEAHGARLYAISSQPAADVVNKMGELGIADGFCAVYGRSDYKGQGAFFDTFIKLFEAEKSGGFMVNAYNTVIVSGDPDILNKAQEKGFAAIAAAWGDGSEVYKKVDHGKMCVFSSSPTLLLGHVRFLRWKMDNAVVEPSRVPGHLGYRSRKYDRLPHKVL